MSWIASVRAAVDAGTRATYGGLFRRDTVCFVAKGQRGPVLKVVSL